MMKKKKRTPLAPLRELLIGIPVMPFCLSLATSVCSIIAMEDSICAYGRRKPGMENPGGAGLSRQSQWRGCAEVGGLDLSSFLFV